MFAVISALVLVLVLTVTQQQNVAALDDGIFDVAVDVDHHPPAHIGHHHDGPQHHHINKGLQGQP